MVNILSNNHKDFFPFSGKDTPIKGASVTIDTDKFPQLRDDILDQRDEVTRLIRTVTEQTERYWMQYFLDIIEEYDSNEGNVAVQYIKQIAERLTIPLA